MNKIDKQLQKIKKENRIGLMTHVVIGYPNIYETEKIIQSLVKGGSDFIELQIPFSDPVADGETIMMASEKALKNGVRVNQAFGLMRKVSSKTDSPLLFMSYYNIVFNFGVERFCKKAKEVGASGLIIPDIPPEEEFQEKYIYHALRCNLYPIRVISPASDEERLQINAKVARGFIYCVSRFGITGAKSSLDTNLKNYLKKVRKYFKIPIAVGFGISNKEQVQSLNKSADIVVIGSAIIDIINHRRLRNKDNFNEIEDFIRGLIKRK